MRLLQITRNCLRVNRFRCHIALKVPQSAVRRFLSPITRLQVHDYPMLLVISGDWFSFRHTNVLQSLDQSKYEQREDNLRHLSYLQLFLFPLDRIFDKLGFLSLISLTYRSASFLACCRSGYNRSLVSSSNVLPLRIISFSIWIASKILLICQIVVFAAKSLISRKSAA